MGPVVCHSLRPRGFADLTDVTLADGDTKSILNDNAKRAIQGNVAMHVNHPVDLVVKFRTNASSAIWWQNFTTNVSGINCWLNLQIMQVGLSGGKICN